MHRILSVGRDHHLMNVRSILLRHYGYTVEEAYSSEEAVRMLEADGLDVVLICHTLAPVDRKNFISRIRDIRRLMPVICLVAREGDSYADCINAENSPAALLQAVRSATASFPGAGSAQTPVRP